MTNTATVDEAAMYAGALVSMRSRGSDKAIAIDRVASDCRIPRGTVWALLYRRPKRVWADVLVNLRDGYLNACEAQLRSMQHEINITRNTVGNTSGVRAGEALLREAADR